MSDARPTARKLHRHHENVVLVGLGICRVHDLIVAPFVQPGQLIAVLAKFVDNQIVPVCAVMLPERHRLSKIKAWVTFWAEWLPEFSCLQRAD